MKDFIKWLGVNEKIAKVVVWFFIFAIMLIIINAALESMGFPYYRITYENLKQVKWTEVLDIGISWLTAILNFYAIVLLVFKTKEYKKLFKFSLIYLALNIGIIEILNEGIVQIFILLYLLILAYFLSDKNLKYVGYMTIAIVVDSVVQGLTYLYKVKFIDYTTTTDLTKLLLFSDYFIIMGIIILVKEIYLKKRGEKNEST